MNILIDVRLLSRGGVSGIEEYTRNLLKSILTIDNKNDYAFFYNGIRKRPLPYQVSGVPPQRGESRPGGHRGGKCQIIDWKIPNKIFDGMSRFFNWPKIDTLIKTDLIFSPHFNILAVKKTPRIITFHDLSFLHYPDFFSWKQRFWHWLQNIKKQAQEADRIIAVSQSTKNDLADTLKIPPEKIEVIHSGISEDFKPLAVNDSLLLNKPFILYLGMIEPRKNLIALIRAFNILKTFSDFKDFQLILAGRQGWLYGNILKEAHCSPFQKDIIFWGVVGHQEKIKFYNSAKVFVYPSFFEGFGFPPLEAQACGCPVIVANRTSLPEVLGKSALFIDPWRIDELVEKIKIVLTNQSLRSRLIDLGLQNAKRFSWDRTAQKTLELFNKYAR